MDAYGALYKINNSTLELKHDFTVSSKEENTSSIFYSAFPLKDGSVIFGGGTNARRAKTGSLIKPAVALFARYNSKGEKIQLYNDSFAREERRNNAIDDLRITKEGRIFVSALLNAPLTHDSKENTYNSSIIYELENKE